MIYFGSLVLLNWGSADVFLASDSPVDRKKGSSYNLDCFILVVFGVRHGRRKIYLLLCLRYDIRVVKEEGEEEARELNSS